MYYLSLSLSFFYPSVGLSARLKVHPLASLYESVSIGRLVSRSVRWSVRPLFLDVKSEKNAWFSP